MIYKKLFISISTLVGVYFGYQLYLKWPQRYDVGSCVIDSQLNELYEVVSVANRRLSFKGNWLLGPMEIVIKVIKPNPNALREVGEIRTVEQEDTYLQASPCK